MDNLNGPVVPNQPAKINWRQFGKHWIVVFILAVLAGFVIWALLNAGPWLHNLQNRWAAYNIRKELEKPYRNDTYGGKTPEETFNMFIAALEKGDIDLASKYFVLDKQSQWSKTLNGYKDSNVIDQLIAELKSYKDNWKLLKNDNKTASFEYSYAVRTPFTEELPLGNGRTQKVTHPAGTFLAEIIFEKNTLSNIWKINEL